MKKKITKKLALSKETLRNLERSDLDRAVGGVTENCYSGNLGCEIYKVTEALSIYC